MSYVSVSVFVLLPALIVLSLARAGLLLLLDSIDDIFVTRNLAINNFRLHTNDRLSTNRYIAETLVAPYKDSRYLVSTWRQVIGGDCWGRLMLTRPETLKRVPVDGLGIPSRRYADYKRVLRVDQPPQAWLCSMNWRRTNAIAHSMLCLRLVGVSILVACLDLSLMTCFNCYLPVFTVLYVILLISISITEAVHTHKHISALCWLLYVDYHDHALLHARLVDMNMASEQSIYRRGKTRQLHEAAARDSVKLPETNLAPRRHVIREK